MANNKKLVEAIKKKKIKVEGLDIHGRGFRPVVYRRCKES